MNTSTLETIQDQIKEVREMVTRAAQQSGKSPAEFVRETMARKWETTRLKWVGYDPDPREFLFRTKNGALFHVSLAEMEQIAEFLRKESERTNDSDAGRRP